MEQTKTCDDCIYCDMHPKYPSGDKCANSESRFFKQICPDEVCEKYEGIPY